MRDHWWSNLSNNCGGDVARLPCLHGNWDWDRNFHFHRNWHLLYKSLLLLNFDDSCCCCHGHFLTWPWWRASLNGGSGHRYHRRPLHWRSLWPTISDSRGYWLEAGSPAWWARAWATRSWCLDCGCSHWDLSGCLHRSSGHGRWPVPLGWIKATTHGWSSPHWHGRASPHWHWRARPHGVGGPHGRATLHRLPHGRANWRWARFRSIAPYWRYVREPLARHSSHTWLCHCTAPF
mmetsp:Transcript_51880/g.121347  ORF Transcript_51880/g.121347 Transcript_51880/m.121347 type:complete len:234 (-) Transcript_51880:53-754(-)